VWTTLLPGLRELRAPLAAGYLWLLAGALALAPTIRTHHRTSAVIAEGYRIADSLGKPGLLVAATFTAYVLGILSMALRRPLLRAYEVITERARFKIVLNTISPSGALYGAVVNKFAEQFGADSAIQQDAEDRLSRLLRTLPHEPGERVRVPTSASDYPLSNNPYVWLITHEPHESIQLALRNDIYRTFLLTLLINVEGYVLDIVHESQTAPARLLGKEPDLYNAYDRCVGESDFRIALALPLFGLIGALVYRGGPWWLFLLPLPVLLISLGYVSVIEAKEMLAAAMATERLESPSLARIAREPTDWRDSSRAAGLLLRELTDLVR
jgi:hypothetical protein